MLIASEMLGHISFDRSKNVNFDRKAKNLEKTDYDIEVIPYNLLSRNWFGTFIYTYMCVLSGMFCNDRMKKQWKHVLIFFIFCHITVDFVNCTYLSGGNDVKRMCNQRFYWFDENALYYATQSLLSHLLTSTFAIKKIWFHSYWLRWIIQWISMDIGHEHKYLFYCYTYCHFEWQK